VSSTGAYGQSGHHDAAGWLAGVSREPVGRAREALSIADAVATVPEVHQAFAAGELSAAEAKVIGEATAVDPSAAEALLGAARGSSFSDLKSMAARAIRQARSEEDAEAEEARVHARRYCRVFPANDGGLRLEALLSKRTGARVLSRLEQTAGSLFTEAEGTGEHEPHDRYRADALVRLVCGGQRDPGGVGEGPGAGAPGGRSMLGCSGPGAHVVVRVDAGALRRGRLEGDEICEIPGIGPVPVSVARELLGDALYTLVVTKGVDVRCVTGTKRTIPKALRIALAERDPVCVVPGCGVAHHLEIDHWRIDYALGGPTSLDNLARLCGRHHAMKTTLGWRLTGGPGNWGWVRPEPRTMGGRSRTGPPGTGPPGTGPPGTGPPGTGPPGTGPPLRS